MYRFQKLKDCIWFVLALLRTQPGWDGLCSGLPLLWDYAPHLGRWSRAGVCPRWCSSTAAKITMTSSSYTHVFLLPFVHHVMTSRQVQHKGYIRSCVISVCDSLVKSLNHVEVYKIWSYSPFLYSNLFLQSFALFTQWIPPVACCLIPFPGPGRAPGNPRA